LNKKIIHINQLSLSYPKSNKVVLENLNLSVKAGELVVLFGENGAGKSTLLKAISSDLTAMRGEILLNAKAIRDWNKKDLAAMMAIVFANNKYSSLLSVFEFISFGRFRFTNWLGQIKAQDREALNAILEYCNIQKLAAKKMNELSDGERQKVLLARALAQETPLMLLDEPTTHLDMRNTIAMFKLLKRECKEHQKTIILSSHRIEESLKIADKIWLFHDKGVLESNPSEFQKSKEMQSLIFGKEELD